MRHVASRWGRGVAAALLAVASAIGLGACAIYNFESGTDGWDLEPGVWSWAPSEGGHALRGEGHGFVRLSTYQGDISSLQFGFRLENSQSSLHANVLESFATGHTRYFVSFGANGVGISRQQGSFFQDLGSGLAAVTPGVFHSAQVLVGGGSIDVFVDGEGVVGVDDLVPPPPGGVSFESLENSVVYVDDVMVGMGPESAPHARAPRPPSALPPGPDVGPFVGGAHTGSISLSGTQVLTLSQGRYTLTEGNINLSGNARLRIQQGAVLVFDRGSSPLFHWGINLDDTSGLEIDGGNTAVDRAHGGLVRIRAFGHALVSIRNAKPWIHYIETRGDATVNIVSSRLVTDIGGQVMLGDRASAVIENSEIGSIAAFIPPGSTFAASGLKSDSFFPDFDLQRDLAVSGIGFNLRMRNVQLIADRLGEGGFERGWVVFADEGAITHISDSTLRKLIVISPASGPDLNVSSLRLDQPANLTLGGVTLSNVTVTGQWGFNIHGSRRATFDKCDGLWFFLYDKAEVLLRNSTMDEFDPRNYTGTLTFENSEWKMTGEIIEGNDFPMRGTVTVDPALRQSLSWSQSAVTRRFPIRVLSAAGVPVPGVTVTLARSSQVVSAITGPTGEASVDLRFTDQDYTQPWQLTTSAGHQPMSVDFFTSTPIVVSVFGP